MIQGRMQPHLTVSQDVNVSLVNQALFGKHTFQVRLVSFGHTKAKWARCTRLAHVPAREVMILFPAVLSVQVSVTCLRLSIHDYQSVISCHYVGLVAANLLWVGVALAGCCRYRPALALEVSDKDTDDALMKLSCDVCCDHLNSS